MFGYFAAAFSYWTGRGKRVQEVVEEMNCKVDQRVEAANNLKLKLTPEERFVNLTKVYRHGKDLIVTPLSWKGSPLEESFSGNKVFVDTPVPSIVRSH